MGVFQSAGEGKTRLGGALITVAMSSANDPMEIDLSEVMHFYIFPVCLQCERA